MLAQVEQDHPRFVVGDPIVIHSDSRYVVDLTKHGSRSKTNVVMMDFLAHLWKKTAVAFDIHILWIRGHSMDVGNVLADKHAGEGADEEEGTEAWCWRPNDWGFSELRQDFPVHFTTGKTTARSIFDGAAGEDFVMRVVPR